jgi:hypothetical protein
MISKKEIEDWIFENHIKYWDSNFDIKDMYCFNGKWSVLTQHINGNWYLRVFFLDKDNYTDFWDYPIEDFKAWQRNRKINKILK